jgi:NAD(P)-dependent dehydrogenase (short-subunit alcohol dehydrogenase family)
MRTVLLLDLGYPVFAPAVEKALTISGFSVSITSGDAEPDVAAGYQALVVIAPQVHVQSDARASDDPVDIPRLIRLVRATAEPMSTLPAGRIVFVNSIVGMSGHAGHAVASAVSAAMIGVARAFAREFAPLGTTSNVIAAGLIEGDEWGSPEVAGAVPARRVGTTAELSSAVVFLCSDRSSYITGAVIPVDGGLGMGH